MENDNGRINFVAGIDTSKIDQDAKRIVNDINEIGTAAEDAGRRAQEALNISIPTSTFSADTIHNIEDVNAAFVQLDYVINENAAAIEQLETELGKVNATSETSRAKDLEAEIALRKQVIDEAHKHATVLDKIREKMQSDGGTTSMRTRLRQLREELANMEMNGQRGTAAYEELRNEMARLTDQMGDTQRQAAILANDQRGFAGVLSGIQGITGAFSAAAGAASLFGEKNEEIQQVMLKIQALMSITMGLQQMSAMLNKDSAFRIVTLGKLQERYRAALAKTATAQQAENAALATNKAAQAGNTAATTANTAATSANATAKSLDATASNAEAKAKTASNVATNANTAAEVKNTVATGANTAATGTMAATETVATGTTWGLTTAFHALKAAILSVPVIGWIIAGATALIAILSKLSSTKSAAAQADEQFTEKMKEQADSLAELRQSFDSNREAWKKLKTAKEKTDFIKKNKEEFHKYGVEVKSISDAEEVFTKDSVKIVKAMDLRAKAAAHAAASIDLYKKVIENEIKQTNWVNEVGQWDMLKEGFSMLFSGDAFKEDAGRKLWFNLRSNEISSAQKEINEWNKQIEIHNKAQQKLIAEANAILGSTGKAYDENSSSKSGGGNNAAALQEAYQSQLRATAEALKNYRLKLADEITAAETDLIKDATEKQIETIRNSADKEREALQEELKKLGAEYKKQAQAKWKMAHPKGTETQWLATEEGKKTDLQYFEEAFNVENAETEEEKTAIQHFLDDILKRNNQISEKRDKAISDIMERNADAAANSWIELQKQYGNKEERRKAIELEAARKIAKALKDNDPLALAKAEKDREADLADFDFKDFQQSPEYVQAFKSLADMPVSALEQLKDKLEEYKDIAADVWKDQPERLREYIDLINQVQEAINAGTTAWYQYRSARSEYQTELDKAKAEEDESKKAQHINKAIAAYNRMRKAEEDVRQQAVKVASATINIGRKAQELAAVWSDDIAEGIGTVVDSLETVKDVADTVTEAVLKLGTKTAEEIKSTVTNVNDGMKASTTAAAQGMSTLEKASAVLAIIGAAIQLATMVANLLSNDKKHEKRIEQLQDQIDKLERSYDRLGRKIEEAYSVDASRMIEQQNTLLRQQQALIRQQIAEEEAKKKTDKDKIKEWKEKLEDITDTIEDNVKKAVDAITGTSLKSAIDEIADAWANAWTDGTNAARSASDVVKRLLKQGIVEYLKKIVTPDIERWYNKMATALADGTITAAERGLLDKEMGYITDKANQYYQQVKDYFSEDSENGGGTRTAFEGMTQDTAEELNGRFTALQIAGEAVRQQVTLIRAQIEESRSIALTSMSHLEDIARNTRELYQMNNRLEQIERNTSRI